MYSMGGRSLFFGFLGRDHWLGLGWLHGRAGNGPWDWDCNWRMRLLEMNGKYDRENWYGMAWHGVFKKGNKVGYDKIREVDSKTTDVDISTRWYAGRRAPKCYMYNEMESVSL